jgi:[lysine-biosynthesis-protein LysW]--L-2-aminoadipate ligase
MSRVVVLAERLRVEERFLLTAFAARGWEANLVRPADLIVPLQAGMTPLSPVPQAVLDRTPATLESVALSGLLAAAGIALVNRTATTRLLADRLAFLRHLVTGQIPVPPTVASFGPESTLRAIEELGYPVYLKSMTRDPEMPVALVEDRDAAEALVEHRRMLGDERAVLVQKAVADPNESVRLLVVGQRLLAATQLAGERWIVVDDARWASLAAAVCQRLGSGMYEIEAVQTSNGQVVLSASNTLEFRSLAEQGVPVAEAIAEYVISVIGDTTEVNSLQSEETGGR